MEMDAGLDTPEHEKAARKPAGRDTTGCSGTGQNGAGAGLPDPDKLARDWITLWQSELSAMAADPEIRESWQTIMALWAGTMGTMLRGLPRTPDTSRHDNAPGRAGSADAPGAQATPAAPDARDAEIERLARDVAALERRLAELERGGDHTVHSRGRSERKPRR